MQIEKETKSINQNERRKKQLDNVLRICYNILLTKTEMENLNESK